jgi:hypothetical protein
MKKYTSRANSPNKTQVQLDCHKTDIMCISDKEGKTPRRPMFFGVRDLSTGISYFSTISLPANDALALTDARNHCGIAARPSIGSIIEQHFAKGCESIRFIDGFGAPLTH